VKLSKEVKVGILAVIALTILYIGLNFLKGIDFFRPNNTYFAMYDDIDGLTVSNPVLINGLRVGMVGDIRILQNMENRILVTIEVDDDIILGDSTVAFLINSDLLGSKAINLEVGRIYNPRQEGDTLIARIDRGITDVIRDTAMPVVENINVSVTEVNKLLSALSNNRNKMDNIFDSFERTSRNIETMSVENRENLNKITANLQQLSEALNNPETGIKPLIANMNQFADSLNNLELKQTVERANIAMQNFSSIMESINEGEGTMGKFVKDDSLYNNLNQSIQDLDRLLIDFRENPKRYVHFSVF
jgi:phospholipid/cholesterol/gamma-HCH transport system substrate-binding protein